MPHGDLTDVWSQCRNFSGVWDQMLGATNEVAGLHMMYAKELSEKLEKPLRGRIHADADWSKLRQVRLILKTLDIRLSGALNEAISVRNRIRTDHQGLRR